MEVFKELEGTGPKVEALLGRGNGYLKKSKDGGANNLQNNLRTLKSRWDNILTRANDKKIKLQLLNKLGWGIIGNKKIIKDEFIIN